MERDPALIGVWRFVERSDGVHATATHKVFTEDGAVFEVTPTYVPIRGQTYVESTWSTPKPEALTIDTGRRALSYAEVDVITAAIDRW